MQQYQGNVMQGSQQLNQSTTDWINSNLGQLQKLNQVDQQNQSNYEQAMLKQAQQMAASDNASKAAMISTGGQVAGAAAMVGAAIII
jgi:hypothetical protein